MTETIKIIATTLKAPLKVFYTQNDEEYKAYEVALTDADGQLFEMRVGEDSADSWNEKTGLDITKLDGDEIELYLDDNYRARLFPKGSFAKTHIEVDTPGVAVVTKVVPHDNSVDIYFDNGNISVRNFSTKIIVKGEDKYFKDFGKRARLLKAHGVTSLEEMVNKVYAFTVEEFNGRPWIDSHVPEDGH